MDMSDTNFWKQIAIVGLIVVLSATIISWALLTSMKKIIEKPIPFRLKASIPIVISIGIYLFLDSGWCYKWPLILAPIAKGILSGALATSLYDVIIKSFLEIIMGSLTKIKDGIFGLINRFFNKVDVEKTDKPKGEKNGNNDNKPVANTEATNPGDIKKP